MVKRKKILALLLVAAMMGSLIACGGKGKQDDATPDDETVQISDTNTKGKENGEKTGREIPADVIPKETVTLVVYSQLANYSGEQVGWFGKVMLDKFNVKLNIIPDSEGTFETRMESGNLGDIVIWGDSYDRYLQAVKNDMLFDWEEENLLYEYGAYIAQNCTLALESNRAKSGNGKIYGIGGEVADTRETISDFQYTWDIRWDLYEQLGKPEVKDLNDLFDLLCKMQEICPTDDNGNKTYAVSMFSDWDGDTVNFPADLVKAYYGMESWGFGFYHPVTQEYYDIFDERSHYIEALRFYNRLYQKGLVDPDSLTQGWNGFTEDAQNGTALWNTISWMASGFYNTDTHLSEGKAMFSLVPKDAVVLNWGQTPEGTNRTWSIGAKTEYPELCMAIINWLYTPEGVMTANYGPKDVCWYYENGKTYFTELGKACSKDGDTEMPGDYKGTFNDGLFHMNNKTWSLNSVNPDTGEQYEKSRWASNKQEAQYEIEQRWRDWSGFDSSFDYITSGKYNVVLGVSYTTEPKSDELTVIWNQVAECIRTNSWKAIYASSDQEFDSVINDMETDARKYGYDECLEYQLRQVEIRRAAENAVK